MPVNVLKPVDGVNKAPRPPTRATTMGSRVS